MESGAPAVRWVPLESNPEVMTQYAKTLGAGVGEWVDVFAFDDDSLAAVKQPVAAVILLFPIKPGYEESSKKQDEEIKQKGQVVAPEIYFMQQTAHNACGTVGVIHALANNKGLVKLREGSSLQDFLNLTESMNSLERGKELEKFDRIVGAHEEAALSRESQTAAPPRDEELVTHFVAFVHKEGHLYELDGRRQFPVNHGPTSAETLLKDACVVCKSRIEADPNEYRYTVVAFTTGN